MSRGRCVSVYDSNKPIDECIGNPEHSEYATKCMNFLNNFPSLKVWDARCHGKKPHPYTCWYVSFKHAHKEKLCIILHFEIRSDDIYLYFRFLNYVPQEMLTNWAWGIRNKWKYVHFKDYAESKLKEIAELYLKNIQGDFDNDNLTFKKFVCSGC
jgi:hypothetical protein